jgi:hypothetical protein
MSTIDVCRHVYKYDMHPVIYFGGPRLRARGVDHVFGAVPRTHLGDGCARGWDWFEGRDI